MADQQNPTPPSQVIPLVYANVMQAAAGGVDLSMDFGYRGPDGQTTFTVKVVMAWEHAAMVHDVIGRLLEQYREEVGEIRDVAKIAQIRQLELGVSGEDAEGGNK